MAPLTLHLALGPVVLDAELDLPAPQARQAVLRRLAAFAAPHNTPAVAALHLRCDSDAWPRPGDEALTRLTAQPLPDGSLRLKRWDLDLTLDPTRTLLRGDAAPMPSSVEEALRLLLAAAFLRDAPRGLLVHGACTVLQGEAWLFPASSGVGKSTLARLTPGDRVLSDELALLTCQDGAWWAWPSPFWNFEDAWPALHPAHHPVPLRHLRFIRQAPRTQLLPMPPDAALAALLRQTVAGPLEMAHPDRVFSNAADLIDALPPHHAGDLPMTRGASPYDAPPRSPAP